MLTDAKLRNLKYRLGGKNRHSDRDGLYAIVNEGGTISFRYDFTDSQGKHQVVTHGRYFNGERISRAHRLAGI